MDGDGVSAEWDAEAWSKIKLTVKQQADIHRLCMIPNDILCQRILQIQWKYVAGVDEGAD